MVGQAFRTRARGAAVRYPAVALSSSVRSRDGASGAEAPIERREPERGQTRSSLEQAPTSPVALRARKAIRDQKPGKWCRDAAEGQLYHLIVEGLFQSEVGQHIQPNLRKTGREVGDAPVRAGRHRNRAGATRGFAAATAGAEIRPVSNLTESQAPPHNHLLFGFHRVAALQPAATDALHYRLEFIGRLHKSQRGLLRRLDIRIDRGMDAEPVQLQKQINLRSGEALHLPERAGKPRARFGRTDSGRLRLRSRSRTAPSSSH